jgi:hypothetical protein
MNLNAQLKLVALVGCSVVGLELAIPAWRATAVRTERRLKVLSDLDLALIRRGYKVTDQYDEADTLSWSVGRLAAWTEPSLEPHAWREEVDSMNAGLRSMPPSARESQLERFAQVVGRSDSLREALLNRYRVPYSLRLPAFATESTGTDVFRVSREVRYTFVVNRDRLFLEIGATAVAFAALCLLLSLLARSQDTPKVRGRAA